MSKKSKKYGLDARTEKVLSGLDGDAIEHGLLNIVDSAVGRKIGIKSGSLWKRDGDVYRAIDGIRRAAAVIGQSVPKDTMHATDVESELLFFNRDTRKTGLGKEYRAGKFHVDIALGTDADYIMRLDLKRWRPFANLREKQMVTAREIGWNVSRALDKVWMYNKLGRYREKTEDLLAAAGKIQDGIVPKGHPDFFGFDAYGMNTRAHKTGGDYYDFLPYNNSLRFAIADVSGKGLASSLLMAAVHAAVDTGRHQEMTGFMRDLNWYLYSHSSPEKFVTMVLGDMRRDGTFEYVNAGHPYPVLFTGEGPTDLGESDIILGVDSDAAYRKNSGRLNKDDILMLYTDGITESQNDKEEEFGLDRLKEAVMDYRRLPSQEIARNTMAALDGFNGYRDDRTIVLIKKEY